MNAPNGKRWRLKAALWLKADIVDLIALQIAALSRSSGSDLARAPWAGR